MSLKLTDTQRRQIQRGSFPHLALEPDEAKALEPHRITITRQLWIEVTGAKRDKKAGWYLSEMHKPRRSMRWNLPRTECYLSVSARLYKSHKQQALSIDRHAGIQPSLE